MAEIKDLVVLSWWRRKTSGLPYQIGHVDDDHVYLWDGDTGRPAGVVSHHDFLDKFTLSKGSEV